MKQSPLILVIDDEVQMRRLLRRTLEGGGYRYCEAENGESGLLEAVQKKPDAFILDLGLPDLDGVEVLKRLRDWSQAPVLILSVRDDEKQKVLALDHGADDYVTKPFAFEELLARVRAVVRKAGAGRAALIKEDDLEIDPVTHKVKRGGVNIDLTSKEYALLEYLARNNGKVITRTMISEHVWDIDFDTGTNIIDVYINYLRKKIDSGHTEKLIQTVRGRGYRFGL